MNRLAERAFSDDRPPSDFEDSNRSRYVELVCPTCHIVSRKIPELDLIAQHGFDDVHRRCYINAIPGH
jgi:hypothetical protein